VKPEQSVENRNMILSVGCDARKRTESRRPVVLEESEKETNIYPRKDSSVEPR